MLLRRRRLPFGDLTNLSSSTSVITRPKSVARSKARTSPSACSSTSSIGSSTAPLTRCPPLPPPPYVGPAIKGKAKSTRELQRSICHLKKTNKIMYMYISTQLQVMLLLKTGDVLTDASSPPSKKTRKVTREELPYMEPLDKSSGEPLRSQDFLEERRAYLAGSGAFELVVEFVSAGSDLE